MQRTVHNLPGSACARWILIITPMYAAVNLAIAIKEDSKVALPTAQHTSCACCRCASSWMLPG